MVLPPAVTRKSRARSTRRSVPSRHSPTSPVCSQPSAPFTLAGRFLVVPIALEQVGAAHQHLAILASRTSKPSTGVPTLPGRGNGPRWPAMMPPAVSVWPYISTTLTPYMCQSAMVSAGSGAPPQTTSSSLSKPSLFRIGRNTGACSAR